jgi:hypothetical protein
MNCSAKIITHKKEKRIAVYFEENANSITEKSVTSLYTRNSCATSFKK